MVASSPAKAHARLQQIKHLLGSIQLAVPLLVAIIAILIGATFYESQVGSPTVQNLIYKSPWFGALMFLLAVNLSVSALSRYPWRGPRKVGFALTHFGLVVLIAGSAAVIHISTEGMLLLRTDAGANNLVRVEGELLDFVGPDGQEQQLDLFIKPDQTVSPSQAGDLKLLRYSDSVITTTGFVEQGEVANPVANPAIKLRLQSDRMNQALERWLAVAPAAYSEVPVGPATLQLQQASSEAELEAMLAVPPKASDVPKAGVLMLDSGKTLDVAQNQGKLIKLAGGADLVITQVWPDFRLNSSNRPETASEQFNNPVLQLALRDGESEARWFVFAQGGFEPIKTTLAGEPLDAAALGLADLRYEVQPQLLEDYFRVVIGPEGDRFYAANSSKGFKSGSFNPGESITPGWADFQISLTDSLDHAAINRQVVETSADQAVQGEPALLVGLPDGTEQWLPWGEATTLADVSGDYYASFSAQLLELPFGVKLEDFIVERNEGSESVAMWTSQIRLDDAQAGASTSSQSRRVWMNHPTWYQGWKIAQASWNPGDLNQSTLQVKREPWWVTGLTWLGSLMVVAGTAVIFYGRSALKGFKAALPEEQAPTKLNPETLPTQAKGAPAAPELETPISV